MKILAFAPYPPAVGGAEKATYKLFQDLSTRHTIYLVTYSKSNKVTRNIFLYNSKLSTNTSFLRGFFYIILSIFWGVCIGMAKQPNIIYAKVISTCGISAFIVSKFIKKPLVLHTSGMDVQYKNVLAKYYGLLGSILGPLHSHIIRLSLQNAEAVIACSNKDAEVLKEYGLKNLRVVHSQHVDIKKFKSNIKIKKQMREKLGIKNSDFVVSYCGRASREKKLGLLLKLAKKFQRFKFLFIGPTMQDLSQFGEVPNNCICTGLVKDVEKYFSVSDIYVHPSKMEGLPISILEAMSCSRPVIASQVGDIKYLIKRGKNGYIADCENEFYNKIILLYSNEELRSFIGKNARKTILTNFGSMNRISRSIEKVFKEIE